MIENAESISLAAFKSLLKHAEFHYDGHLVLVSRQLVSRITVRSFNIMMTNLIILQNYPMIHQINFEPGVQAMEQVLLSVFVKSYDYSSFVRFSSNRLIEVNYPHRSNCKKIIMNLASNMKHCQVLTLLF